MNIVSDVLLGFGVLVLFGCSIGVLAFPRAADRLHFLGPAGLLGLPAVALAVCLAQPGGIDIDGLKALFAALLLLVSGPVVTHAVARAHYHHSEGGRTGADAPEDDT